MKTFTLAQLAVYMHKAFEAGQDNTRTRILAHVQDKNNPVGSRSMKELCATHTNFDQLCPDPSDSSVVIEELLFKAAKEHVAQECHEVINKVFYS